MAAPGHQVFSSILSDADLRVQLKSHGFIPGPITDTTRHMYVKKLKRLRESEGQQSGSYNSQSPSKRQKVENSPRLTTSRGHRRYSNPRPGSRSPSPVPSAPPHPTLSMPSPLVASTLAPSSSSSSIMDVSSSPSSHPTFPKLACTNNDIQSSFYRPDRSPQHIHEPKRRKTSEESPSLASVVSSTVQSGLQSGLQLLGEIGDGVKKLVNPILNAASPRSPIRKYPRQQLQQRNIGSPSRSPSRIHVPSQAAAAQLNRTPPSSFGRFDSVEIGGEIEIDDADSELQPDRILTPSAPPPPEAESKYDWELVPADVQICLKPDGKRWRLGKGGFGEVFKGLKDGVDEVAVKVIHLQNQTTVVQFKSEIDLISKLRHRHIVQFYGACVKLPCLYMVTELMQNDLFNALKKDIRYHWSGIYGQQVAEGIASGLHYLHSRKPTIVHRDIKSPNILLMDGVAKIADVGVARTKGPSDMTAQRGFTIAWAAPEVVYRRRATEKIDIWSFGIILWEIFTGRPPSPGLLVMPGSASAELRKLFSACTAEDPAQRPTAAFILRSLKDMA